MSGAIRSERLDELMVDRAVFGLSEAEHAELRGLSGGEFDDAAFETELAAAALALAALPVAAHREDVPSELRRRLDEDARRALRSPEAELARPVGEEPRDAVIAKLNWWGWMAAAASLTLAGIGWWPRLAGGERPSPERIAVEPGAVTSRWASWSARPAGEDPQARSIDWSSGVEGRVVWSNERQCGFMIFKGMQANDPRVAQYQLWIIDEAQKHPVDGGVFDITGDGEVIVPITPKIRVSNAVAFGVTIEKPGGVVVSDQHERVVVASAK